MHLDVQDGAMLSNGLLGAEQYFQFGSFGVNLDEVRWTEPTLPNQAVERLNPYG